MTPSMNKFPLIELHLNKGELYACVNLGAKYIDKNMIVFCPIE